MYLNHIYTFFIYLNKNLTLNCLLIGYINNTLNTIHYSYFMKKKYLR